MMTIPCYVDKSPIHGKGLFAAKPIKKDTVVWRFDPSVDVRIPKDIVDTWHRDVKAKVTHYCVLADDGCYIMSLDDSKYINHSKQPNISMFGLYNDIVALRDIGKDEEIVSQYLDMTSFSA